MIGLQLVWEYSLSNWIYTKVAEGAANNNEARSNLMAWASYWGTPPNCATITKFICMCVERLGQGLENSVLSTLQRNLQNWQDNTEFTNKMELQNLGILTTEYHRINVNLSWNLQFEANFAEFDEKK